jgi:hypothetical protein
MIGPHHSDSLSNSSQEAQCPIAILLQTPDLSQAMQKVVHVRDADTIHCSHQTKETLRGVSHGFDRRVWHGVELVVF